MSYQITVLPEKKTIQAFEGEMLLDALTRAQLYLPASCGGNGTCGKCKVKILQGSVKNVVLDKEGYVLSCKAVIHGNLTIFLPVQTGGGVTDFSGDAIKGERTGYGIALDIGTTTLAACLVRLDTGEIIQKVSALNPQGVCGADVLSRIQACNEGKLSLLQSLILEKTKELIQLLAKGAEIEELCVSANTTMLHLFLGVDPQTIGVYPFVPVFTNERIISGKVLNLPVKTVRLLPSASAYIGSDITAGVLACAMYGNDKTELFVDVGTNGEIVLSHKGKLYATSTAAGPALEGACIECGIGGVLGAIDKVFLEKDELYFTTIGGEKPKGICGSGLIDLLAILKNEKLIDENGTWDEETQSPLLNKLCDDKFYLTESIYLSQKDIRQFQLAKSAILSGIETLLEEKAVNESKVETLYLAGGLGYYMNLRNATTTGLLPRLLENKTKAVGNTALAGAVACLLRKSASETVCKIAKETEIVELSFSRIFQEKYMENMSF